jgi:hypothetical protein
MPATSSSRLGIEPVTGCASSSGDPPPRDPALAITAAAVPVVEEIRARGSPARRLVSVVARHRRRERAGQLDQSHAPAARSLRPCGAVIERGGTEGYADAVVGVFGQAQVREDDALRAVRAAVEMRAAGGEPSWR